MGHNAGYNNAGSRNNFIGYQAGYNNTAGGDNTFMGDSAGYSNTTGADNTFLGSQAGNANISGGANTFLGYVAGQHNTTGNYNTFLGYQTGVSNTSGINNTFLGSQAGASTTGSNNVFVGFAAGGNETTGSNKLYIANSNTTSPLICGEFDHKLVQVNGTLIIGGPGGSGSTSAAAVGPSSPDGHSSGMTTAGESDPKAVRLGSGPLVTVDKVGTLKAGKWCSSPDGFHVACTQDPPVMGQRGSS